MRRGSLLFVNVINVFVNCVLDNNLNIRRLLRNRKDEIELNFILHVPERTFFFFNNRNECDA
jgi:hypothetical protein